MPNILLLLLLISSFTHATPPPIQQATKFHDDINIDQYWVSEKLDGIRGYWNGKHLISKQGNIFPAPKWFTEDFPEQSLDGELWISRNQFDKVSSIVRTQKGADEEWKSISFMIFDLPNSPDTFTQRLKVMQKLVEQSTSPYLKIIPQQKIKSHHALQLKLDNIIDNGGEGLMLHHENAYYQAKRSQDLMKLKRYDDAEAVVLEYVAGKGKHLGRMGALVVKNTEGIVFKIGTGFSDQERENPPHIGDTITYQYIGKTKNNVPRFASYLRIRYPVSP